MKNNWQQCKNILVVRLDNMGDLLMSTPALRALKKTFDCHLTLLTSSMGAAIAPYLDGIDDVITADVPWVKSDKFIGPDDWNALVERLQRRKFDGAIVFTVFSQNPMPAILLTYLAGIPNRLAYCRENPYHLLTDWIAEQEPYTIVRHQVQRDLFLVSQIGASTSNDSLTLNVPNNAYSLIDRKLAEAGIDRHRQWIIVHPGASERKREYPMHLFKTIVKRIINELGVQVVITGSEKEIPLAEELSEYADNSQCVAMAGELSIPEFMALIDIAPMVLSVNTATIHIAAALNTPLVVLYAKTNPQHTPWKVPHELFLFPYLEDLRSKNEILRYVQDKVMPECSMPHPDDIVISVARMLQINVVRST